MFDDRESSIKNLQKTGEELLATTEDEDKRKEIKEDLQKITSSWDVLKECVDERREKLDETLVAAEKFNVDLDDVLKKLDAVDKNLKSEEHTPSADPKKVDEQINNVKNISDELKDLEPLIQAVMEDEQQLELFCTTPEDTAIVLDKVDKLNKKFHGLDAECQQKEDALHLANDLLEEFFNKDKELDDWMNEVKKEMEEKQPNGAEAEKVKKLQKEVVAHKVDVEKLKELAKELKKVVKPDDYPELKKVVEAAEEKYKNLKINMDETARDMFMAKEKVQEFDSKLDELTEWTNQTLNKYRVMEPVAVEADKIKEQLSEQQEFTAEIKSKEPQFKEVYKQGEEILMGSNEEEEPVIKEKIDSLKFNKKKVDEETEKRNNYLVEALLLAQQFADTHKDVEARLSKTEDLLKVLDDEKGRGVEMQKEKLQNVEDNINQLQPLMGSLRATGSDLIKLSGPGDSSSIIQKKLDACEERWNALKRISEDKGITIGAAAEQVEAVWSNLDELIEKNHALKAEFKNQKPVPVHEEPIAEEFTTLEQQEVKLDELNEPVSNVNNSINNILQEDPKSPASLALKDKQRKLNNLSKYNTGAATDRRNVLEGSRDGARKFWPGLEKLKDTLLDVQTKMDDQGEPSIEPEAIDEMLKEHEEMHNDLNSNEDVIAMLSEVTPVLVIQASQEDKIDVHKQLSDITEQWDSIEHAWAKRKEELENIKEIAVEFTNEKNHVEGWLTEAEEALKGHLDIPSDMAEIRDNLRKQRLGHRDLTKHQREITTLSQKGQGLADRVNEDDADKIREKLEEIEKRWDDLLDNSYECQHQLEEALLQRGHFGVAIEELLVWINQTKTTLITDEEISRDKKLIEVEVSKLRIISNDVQAHKPSVEHCQQAAQKILAEKANPDLQEKLTELNVGWDEIQDLLKERDGKLKDAFAESRKFQDQVRELTVWLSEAKTFLKSKRPFGGKVQTASKQLEKHQEFVKVIEVREEVYIYIVETFEVLIRSSDISSSRVLEKALHENQFSWTEVTRLSQETTDRLEDSLENARTLESYISEVEIWIVRVEGSLSLFSEVSTILETIKIQIIEFDEIYLEISEKREVFRKLKQIVEVIVQKCPAEEANLINEEVDDLTKRWKGLNAKLKGRKKVLDENYDQSKILFEGHEQLMMFLDDIENKISSDPSIGKDASIVKTQMRKHKVFQNELGKKQSKLNATVKCGKILIGKSTPADATVLDAKINDLRARWDAVCTISVDRQHQLEEALLFHGMFHEAVQALLDWINAVEPGLATETAVMGDKDTVKLLIDNHKTFVRDLEKRKKNYDSIVSTGEAMLNEGKVDNKEELAEQLNNLKTRWDSLNQMAATKHERLQNAYKLAKEFRSGSLACVDNLAVLEAQLKEQGPLAEDAPGIRKQIEDFAVFQEQLDAEEVRVNACLKKGEVILRFCHPSALQTIRHQIAVLKKRWHDVSGWAKQRHTRLNEGIEQLREEEIITQELMEWINEQEVILEQRERTPLPEDYEILSVLLDEHKITQQDAEDKQPSYNKITKNAKRKPLTDRQRRAMTPSRGRPDQSQFQRDFANPIVAHLSKRWQHLWLLLMDRYRRLQEQLDEIRIRKAAADFSWDEWKNRYNNWLRESKSRVLDMWRKNDHDKDNKLTREQFVTGLSESGFPTERWEIELVFEKNVRRHLISYQDFMDALKGRKRKPDKELTESEEIHDIIGTEVSKCSCSKAYSMHKVGDGKYRFGDTQKLRLVRILRSMVMVRVGGGWESLAEFLDKNDPCRGRYQQHVNNFFLLHEKQRF